MESKKKPKIQKTMPFDIESNWLHFSTDIFRGRDVSEIQYSEMKKAFYAGTIEAMMFCMRDLPNYPESVALDIFSNIRLQILKYGEELGNGN